MTDVARSILDAFHLDPELFSRLAFVAAGESQKATAIPALVAVAALSLLAVVLWIGAVAWVWRRASNA